MKQVTAEELKSLLQTDSSVILLDVREEYEHAEFNIGGLLCPLSELFDHTNEIPKDKPVVVYCKMGIRSQIAIQRLEQRYQFTNLVNLQGGIEAWKHSSR
jgi:rhodanese-related sulfurtransferase